MIHGEILPASAMFGTRTPNEKFMETSKENLYCIYTEKGMRLYVLNLLDKRFEVAYF